MALLLPDPYEQAFGLPKPNCCSNGDCCKGASPSKPYGQLLARSAQGDDFARGFFSIMIPYPSHDAARAVVPGLVERMLIAARKQPQDFPEPETDLAFYHCRYLQPDNRCGVYEDRPQFCRDYPDSPFMVFAPGCAFEDWGKACQQKAQSLGSTLEGLKEQLQALRAHMPPDDAHPVLSQWPHLQNIDGSQEVQARALSVLLGLTPLWTGSPLCSVWF